MPFQFQNPQLCQPFPTWCVSEVELAGNLPGAMAESALSRVEERVRRHVTETFSLTSGAGGRGSRCDVRTLASVSSLMFSPWALCSQVP